MTIAEQFLSCAASAADLIDRPVLDAAGYFATALADHDPVDSEVHRAVRRRGLEAAAGGPSELAASVRAAADRLEGRFDTASLERPLAVISGITVTLAEYLPARVVELVVHCDDLAISVGPDPDLGEAAPLEAVRGLAELAARRGGALAAVRALARHERHPHALRAL